MIIYLQNVLKKKLRTLRDYWDVQGCTELSSHTATLGQIQKNKRQTMGGYKKMEEVLHGNSKPAEEEESNPMSSSGILKGMK
jgi:hypothetical protein